MNYFRLRALSARTSIRHRFVYAGFWYCLFFAGTLNAQQLYWSQFGTPREIRRAPLSGGAIIGTFASGGDPDDLAVDPVNKKLYWVNQFSDVFRSTYDGG